MLLHAFMGHPGEEPYNLTPDAAGNLYGTTLGGGGMSWCLRSRRSWLSPAGRGSSTERAGIKLQLITVEISRLRSKPPQSANGLFKHYSDRPFKHAAFESSKPIFKAVCGVC